MKIYYRLKYFDTHIINNMQDSNISYFPSLWRSKGVAFETDGCFQIKVSMQPTLINHCNSKRSYKPSSSE